MASQHHDITTPKVGRGESDPLHEEVTLMMPGVHSSKPPTEDRTVPTELRLPWELVAGRTELLGALGGAASPTEFAVDLSMCQLSVLCLFLHFYRDV